MEKIIKQTQTEEIVEVKDNVTTTALVPLSKEEITIPEAKDDLENNSLDESTSDKKEESAPKNSEVKDEEKKEDTIIVDAEEVKNEDGLVSIDKNFIYDIMSIPTSSGFEYRMVTYIILWARKNNIEYHFDDYGNVYLTKGVLSEGEFYPCVTSHLDTVQDKAKPYAQAGVKLDVKTRIKKDKHELYLDGMGIGADDKAGIAICLSMFSHLDKIKACFFLEEERGCIGSKKLDKEWFKDVGYVIGYDSPELNRAAFMCSGTKLFDQTFFKTYMQDICKKYGVDDFRSESFTDVKEIREQTDIICMNFGNGGYLAHGQSEYCVLEEMDNACSMGIALIEFIGNTEHKLKSSSSSYGGAATYGYNKDEESDYAFYARVAGRLYTNSTNTYRGGSYNSGYYGGYNYNHSTTTTTASTVKKTIETDKYNYDQIQYIIETYEEHIEGIENSIKAKCEELGISFDSFKEIFSHAITF